MALNTGTLISAAIRPVDSLDPIASAFASEIKGGLHTATSSAVRDSIIFERREWGMLCYVTNLDKTYQLKYGYASTDIMNNSNWVEFSGSGGGGGTEWLDSVKSVLNTQPGSPSSGDRYLVGSTPTGTPWSTYPDYVTEWNATTNSWTMTQPKDGMSVRVDDEDESIYKYEGVYPSGVWKKERVDQIRSVQATTVNGLSYSVTTSPQFGQYLQDMIFLTKFSSSNTGLTMSIDINSLGHKLVKKPSASGLTNLVPGEIEPGIVYTLTYDGTFLQINRPYTNDDIFSVKYYVEPNDYIVVPQYYQYWVLGDLEIAGNLVNYGNVIVSNGNLILSGGTFSNFGQFAFVNLETGTVSVTFSNTDTIEFFTENLITGVSASAIVRDGSLTASKLNTGTNGGATAGYLLSVDGSGDFAWIDPNTTVVATFDDKNFTMTQNTTYDNFFVGLTISTTPVGYVTVHINGVESDVGYGSTSSNSCYFSGDGGVTAKLAGSIVSGDGLYWNGSVAGFELTTDLPDRISLNYLI